mmetsp:Transcript_147072/g.208571  ORF Transcript_147072/g.208571 Transcript_147072/m.208571 type:complete len:179 (+) Transcript_147072:517-1053(+)
MGFAGLNTMFINQCIQWGFLFSSVLLFFTLNPQDISYIEAFMIAISVFLRICTISSKYGSMHPVRIKTMKTKYLTFEELTQDFMLIKWRDQTDDVVEQELIAAIKRNDVDTALFFYSFLGDVDRDMKSSLLRNNSNIVQMSQKIVKNKFLGLNTVDGKVLEEGDGVNAKGGADSDIAK